MPELLIFAKDWSAELTDPEQIANLPKLGDVIVWKPDGWEWSEEERKNPLFRIIKWTGKGTAYLDELVKPLPPVFDKDQKQVTAFQYRAKGFDISSAAQNVKDHFNNQARASEKLDVTTTPLDDALFEKIEVSIPSKGPPISDGGKIKSP